MVNSTSTPPWQPGKLHLLMRPIWHGKQLLSRPCGETVLLAKFNLLCDTGHQHINSSIFYIYSLFLHSLSFQRLFNPLDIYINTEYSTYCCCISYRWDKSYWGFCNFLHIVDNFYQILLCSFETQTNHFSYIWETNWIHAESKTSPLPASPSLSHFFPFLLPTSSTPSLHLAASLFL